MKVITGTSSTPLPFGTSSGPAADHMARVIDDGGTGLDQTAITDLFNLFPSQILPTSMTNGCFATSFTGYKIEDGVVNKVYSITGPAHDLVLVNGQTGANLLSSVSAINNRAAFSFPIGLLREVNAVVGDTNEYGIISLFSNPTEGNGIFTYMLNGTSFINITEKYGAVMLNHTYTYTNYGTTLNKSPWMSISMGWTQTRTPNQLQGYSNSQYVTNGNGIAGSLSSVNDWYWGASAEYGYPSQGTGAQIAVFGRLSLDDEPTRTALYNYIKTYYNIS